MLISGMIPQKRIRDRVRPVCVKKKVKICNLLPPVGVDLSGNYLLNLKTGRDYSQRWEWKKVS